MSNTLKTVKLYGKLGSKFGRKFELAVSSPAEAVNALCHQLDGFKAFLNTAKERGMVFAVFVGKKNIGKDEIGNLSGKEEIRIAPVIEGAKRGGVLQVIVGAVLIAISFIPVFAAFAPTLMSMGVSMVLGGVVQMLAPQPKGLGAKEDPRNQPSYAFNGPVNTQAQGNPVPLAYGEVWTGSAVISGGVMAEDQL